MKKQILYIKVSQFDEIFYLLVTGPGVLSNELSCSATFCLLGVLPSPLLEPGGLPTGPFCNTPCFCSVTNCANDPLNHSYISP
jgi:hypothetical protein